MVSSWGDGGGWPLYLLAIIFPKEAMGALWMWLDGRSGTVHATDTGRGSKGHGRAGEMGVRALAVEDWDRGRRHHLQETQCC